MTRLWGVKCFIRTSSAKQSSCSWSWQHFSKKLEKSAVTASCCSSVMSGFCFTRLTRSLGFKTKGNTGESAVQWHFPKMLLVEHFQSPGSPHPQPSLLPLIGRLSLLFSSERLRLETWQAAGLPWCRLRMKFRVSICHTVIE